jgi:hypothetical protein
VQAQAVGEINRLVGAVVVDQNADVYEVRQFSHRGFESLFRVVGRHYNRNVFAVDHWRIVSSLPEMPQ